MTPLAWLLCHLIGWPTIALAMLHHAAVNARVAETVATAIKGVWP